MELTELIDLLHNLRDQLVRKQDRVLADRIRNLVARLLTEGVRPSQVQETAN